MWKLTGLFVIALAALVGGSAKADDQTDFKVCQSTYALCTTASMHAGRGHQGYRGLRLRGEDGLFGRSSKIARPKKWRQAPEQKSSRVIFRSRAMPSAPMTGPGSVLDKPCTIDKDDPTKASCACTSVKDQGPYIIITDTLTSITPAPRTSTPRRRWTQVTQVTDFLKTNADLKPFDIEVLNSGK